MIDVKELRINNYVLCKNEVCRVNMINRGDIVEVSTIDSDSVKECFVKEFLSDRICPILLTEELLLKCRMNECNDDAIVRYIYRNGKFKMNIIIHGLKKYIVYIYNIESGEQICCKEIQYLHQLQNIYFTLTGKELEVTI